MRTELTAALTMYVTSGGSPASPTCSIGAPCASVQQALHILQNDYDLRCNSVVIEVEAGMNAGNIYLEGAFVGFCSIDQVKVRGDTSMVSMPLLDVISLGQSAKLWLEGLSVKNLSTADGGTSLWTRYMEFRETSGSHMIGATNSRLRLSEYARVVGGANNFLEAPYGQVQLYPGLNIDFVNTPTFDKFGYATELGLVNTGGVHYNGAVNITWRCASNFNSLVNDGGGVLPGATPLPGGTGKTSQTLGLCVVAYP